MVWKSTAETPLRETVAEVALSYWASMLALSSMVLSQLVSENAKAMHGIINLNIFFIILNLLYII
jgi:hypothetical protein